MELRTVKSFLNNLIETIWKGLVQVVIVFVLVVLLILVGGFVGSAKAYIGNSVTDIPEMRNLELEACLRLEYETLQNQAVTTRVNDSTYQVVHDRMTDYVYKNVLTKIYENAATGIKYRDISQAQVIAMSKVAYGFGYYSGKKTCKTLIKRN